MRGIKFRAWDKENNKMISSDQVLKICFVSESKQPNLIVYSEKQINNHKDIKKDDKRYCYDFELMQYTGVKDKNGKEIYEEDIATVDIIYPNSETETHTGFIKFSEPYCGFVLTSDTKKWMHYHGATFESLKIIGNTYENPELLEVEE